ncbi:MAG: glycosyltransferase family 4 protein [Candidatus Hodarchaeota archaeon]
MKILLISDSYPPEVRSASRLMHEFATGMVQYGHSVTVLTAFPRYNLAEGTSNDFNSVAHEDAVRVVRVNTLKVHLVNMARRGIGVVSLPYCFIRAAKKHLSDHFDIIFVYSPPLTLSIVGKWLAKYYKSKCVLNVQDLFPQNAIDLGIIKDPITKIFFESIEKYAYRAADFITVHSHGNFKILTEKKNVPDSKIAVCHNWVKINNSKSVNFRGLSFRQEFALSDKFVILFAGVIGPAQGLEVIIPAAERLIHTKACFLVVGDGSEKQKLQKEAIERKLGNIVFKPFVKLDQYDSLLEVADAGLLTLSKDMKTPVVPGKLVSLMAKKIPVVASLNPDSDARQIIKESKCGYVSNAGDAEALAKNISKIMEFPRLAKEMGDSGWRYVRDNFSEERILKKYNDIFSSLLSL